MTIAYRAGVACALLSLLAGASALTAQETAVWRIGTFDHTSAEFGGSSARPVTVNANAPDVARQWPASQSGTRNAKAAPQSHAREIRFGLSEAPRGAYVFDLALQVGNPRVPRLELEWGELTGNDKVGTRGWLPETSGEFLGVNGDSVEVETVNRAEDGNGYIARLLETAGMAKRVRLASGIAKIDGRGSPTPSNTIHGNCRCGKARSRSRWNRTPS